MGLADYRRAISITRRDLSAELARVEPRPWRVAVLRDALTEMERQVAAVHWRAADLRFGPTMGAIRWHAEILELVSRRWHPQIADPQVFGRKLDEIERLIARLASWTNAVRLIEIPTDGIAYLIQENQATRTLVARISEALRDWFMTNHLRPGVMRWSAQQMLAALLQERTDLVAALRIAQRAPLDSERMDIGIDRPVVVEIVEFAVGLIPFVGNAVAAYEVYSGRDLFGYRLTEVERGILAAAILLPAAGRLCKGGRALYTGARLQRLYGPDAGSGLARVLPRAERVSADAAAARTLREAEAVVRQGERIERTLAERVVAALRSARHPAATPAVAQATREAFERLSQRVPALQSLDELAMQRIIDMGPNVDHMKGQLLEELLESRIVGWLRDPAGRAALGLQGITGELHFVPGHLIRDAGGRQITDGMIGRWVDSNFEVVAVFEAKAGRSAARGLRTTSGGRATTALRSGRLTEGERAELLGYARDVLGDQREAAEAAGQTFTRTLDDVLSEISLTETGGQIARDFERMGASVGAAGDIQTVLRVAGESVEVNIGRRGTRFFGVLPSDVPTGSMAAELRDLGYAFDIMSMPVTSADLRRMARDLANLVAP